MGDGEGGDDADQGAEAAAHEQERDQEEHVVIAGCDVLDPEHEEALEGCPETTLPERHLGIGTREDVLGDRTPEADRGEILSGRRRRREQSVGDVQRRRVRALAAQAEDDRTTRIEDEVLQGERTRRASCRDQKRAFEPVPERRVRAQDFLVGEGAIAVGIELGQVVVRDREIVANAPVLDGDVGVADPRLVPPSARGRERCDGDQRAEDQPPGGSSP